MNISYILDHMFYLIGRLMRQKEYDKESSSLLYFSCRPMQLELLSTALPQLGWMG